MYRNTKEVIKAIHDEHEDRLKTHLISQGSFFSNIIDNSLYKVNSVWSLAQRNLPKNIFNFTIHYINNSLSTRKNLVKWGMSPTSDCSFCLLPETLLHVVSGCNTYVVTRKHCSLGHFLVNADFLSFIHSHSQITHLGHHLTSLLSSHTWSFLFCCSLCNHHTMSQFNNKLTST